MVGQPSFEGGRDPGFAELSRRARNALAGAFKPCPPDLVPSFRLWHYPVAGPQVTWVAFQCRVDTPKGVLPRLRRILWRRDHDLLESAERRRRRPRLEPTMESAEADLEEAPLNRFVKEATGLPLPRYKLLNPYVSETPPEFGLEGFDVEGRDGRKIVRVEWGAAPGLLDPVADWSARVRAWFSAVLP